jgi:type IV pilus assembly protein PilE
MRFKKTSGFTLVEIMVVTAIVAILGAIALPAYRQYVVRSNRSAAMSQMMDIVNREQQFLLVNRAYADKAALTDSGYVLSPEVSRLYTWDVEVPESTVPSFVITFTPTGSQGKDGALTIDNQGRKTPAEKWQR